MSTVWTADSPVVTADSPLYTASGSVGSGIQVSAQFPNVPALLGVPDLARMATAAVVSAEATVAGETQALSAQLGLPITIAFGTNAFYSGLGLQPLSLQSPSSQSPSQSQNANPSIPPGALPLYGITRASGDPIVLPDSAVEVDVSADSNINSHPIEEGGFSAYNRVQEPISIRLLLACQGKNMTRPTFLSTLEDLREGTQIVTVSTPDASYPNMTLKGYGYKKTADRGAVTIWADTQWVEERSTNVVVSAPPTSQPQGAAVANLGTLQPTTVSPPPPAVKPSFAVSPPFAPAPTGFNATASAWQLATINSPPVAPGPLPLTYTATGPPLGAAW
jgi:hypothetical protein